MVCSKIEIFLILRTFTADKSFAMAESKMSFLIKNSRKDNNITGVSGGIELE